MKGVHRVRLESLRPDAARGPLAIALSAVLDLEADDALALVDELPVELEPACNAERALELRREFSGYGGTVSIDPEPLGVRLHPTRPPQGQKSLALWLVGIIIAISLALLLFLWGILHQESAAAPPVSEHKKEAYLVRVRDSLASQAMMQLSLAQRAKQEITAPVPADGDLFPGVHADSALHLLRIAAATGPEDPGILEALSYVLRRKGRYADAVAAARQAALLAPEEPSAWDHLGVSWAEWGRHDEAAASFRKALELDSGDMAALQGLGTLHLRYLGDTGLAVRYLWKALSAAGSARAPGTDELRKELVDAAWRFYNPPASSWFPDTLSFSRYEQERKRLRGRLDMHADASLLEDLGLVYLSRRMYGAAETAFADAWHLDGDRFGTARMLVVLRMQRHAHEGAMAVLKQAVQRGASDPFFSRNLAIMEKFLKSDSKAARLHWPKPSGAAVDLYTQMVDEEMQRD